jgi:serine/threonine protein kinase
MKLFKGTNGHLYEVEKLLGSGGQGSVFQVKSKADGKLYAIKWYHPSIATADQLTRLQMLVEQGAPRIALDSIEFIWPLEIVSDPESTGYGYLMPLVDRSQYVSLNTIIMSGKVKQPNPRILARLSYLVCVALDAIHAAGLAYCDINLKNLVFFDPQKGRVRVIIWDNDNVVVNNADVEIRGVWEFMAPEVALGQAKPNAETDLYSIAVLLYYMWMWEHPMDGKKTFSIYCWDIPAKRKFFAQEPVFAFHPSDTSNAATGVNRLELSVQRWEKLCPPVLKKAFTKSFTEGVREPSKRIRLADWRRLFLALEANAYSCPKCGAYNLVDGKLSQPKCFHCATPLPQDLVLRNHQPGSRAQLVVHQNALLRRHHIGYADSVAEADKIVGEIEAHPKSPGAHILRNRTQETWTYGTPSGQFSIEPGQARALLPNSQLSIGRSTIVVERLLEPG